MTNKAKCLTCGDVIQSKHRHDFVVCTCWKKNYARYERIKKAVHIDDSARTPLAETNTGIAVDGGSAYFRFLCSSKARYRII